MLFAYPNVSPSKSHSSMNPETNGEWLLTYLPGQRLWAEPDPQTATMVHCNTRHIKCYASFRTAQHVQKLGAGPAHVFNKCWNTGAMMLEERTTPEKSDPTRVQRLEPQAQRRVSTCHLNCIFIPDCRALQGRGEDIWASCPPSTTPLPPSPSATPPPRRSTPRKCSLCIRVLDSPPFFPTLPQALPFDYFSCHYLPLSTRPFPPSLASLLVRLFDRLLSPLPPPNHTCHRSGDVPRSRRMPQV